MKKGQSLDQLSLEHLSAIFGQTLPQRILDICLSQVQIVQPKSGQLFWDSTQAESGIYWIWEGKVRLLDREENLLLTLEAGSSFGELSLFTEQQNYQPHFARASLNLKLAFFPRSLIDSIIRDFPSVRSYLYQQSREREQQLRSSAHPAATVVTSPPQLPPSPSPRVKFPRPRRNLGHWWQKLVRNYPIVLQQSISDCGAACLAMIGRYWGKNFSISRLRERANSDRNGATLKSLAGAAEEIGFHTRPVRASLDKLNPENLPCIVHWENNHYIVLYAIQGKQVIVGDPACGQKTLSRQAFQSGWGGCALLLEPTLELQKTAEASSSLGKFFQLIKPHGGILLQIFLASILLQVFGLITPIFTQLLLDRVVVQRSHSTLTAIGIGLLVFGIFRIAIGGLRQYLLDHTANRVDVSLIVGFISHTLRLPLSFFESRYVGDIMARVGENSKIQRFLTSDALAVILDLLTIFVYLGVMFWYSWKLSLLVLLVIPPLLLLTLLSTPLLQKISREIFQAVAAESPYLIQVLTGIRTIKSMAIEQRVRWQWESFLHQSVRQRFQGQVVGNQLQLLSSTLQTLSSTALLWYGAWLAIENELSIGQLVAFNMLLGNVINPFQRLAGLWHEFQEILIAVERLNDVLDSPPEEDLLHQARQILPRLQGHISFENVSFRYHPDEEMNVLENLNFEIQPGQTIALVGRSGSGKTTVAKLILGLYQPYRGRILIDGQDISNLALASLRQQIGIVDQDTFLFGDTIRENISLGHSQASLEEVMRAAELAGAAEFIQKLPLGYETKIGEAGGLLSGGQRQRLAIARALLGNPPVLIFDEATSHLDAESERLIQSHLQSVLGDRTAIIIAHRLSTIRQADQILVLDRGLLVERGTHAELINRRGIYFYLNTQQLTVL
jgi:ATP-binding cassette subfamily B protein